MKVKWDKMDKSYKMDQHKKIRLKDKDKNKINNNKYSNKINYST